MARVVLILLLLLIALDVLGNMLLGGSWRNTLSAVAWKNRAHRFFGWCHRFIDGMPWFGRGHCQEQHDREEEFGSVWAAWRHEWSNK